MKFSIIGLLGLAASAFKALAQHDTSGALANPASSLQDKATAIGPAIESAGADIVKQGLLTKLGPDAAAEAMFALPLLEQVISSATSQKEALEAPAA